VWDIGEFVFKHFEQLVPHLDQNVPKETVTYHLPCHLKNHGQDKNMVENLLKQLPYVDYQKTRDWDSCCGGGGFFFNEYPDISKKIVDGKIKNAVSTGAQSWATGCPGCRVQLSGNLPQKDMLDVCHPMEIIAKGLK
jgi:glycolate oxidase iron-sulfur subunit